MKTSKAELRAQQLMEDEMRRVDGKMPFPDRVLVDWRGDTYFGYVAPINPAKRIHALVCYPGPLKRNVANAVLEIEPFRHRVQVDDIIDLSDLTHVQEPHGFLVRRIKDTLRPLTRDQEAYLRKDPHWAQYVRN